MLKVSIFIILAMSIMIGIIVITEPYPTAYAGKDSTKELCKENGGEWEDGECDFKTDEKDKADKFSDEVDKIRTYEEERAAEEDALCDDEDAETTNMPLCKSNDLRLEEAFAEKYNKENCEDNNGEWIDGECDFYENQMKEGWEVDEENFYKEVCKDDDSDKCEKHRLSIEDGE